MWNSHKTQITFQKFHIIENFLLKITPNYLNHAPKILVAG